MNPKNTWLLAMLAAALFAFIYFVERHIQPVIPAVPKVLPGFKAAAVTSIEVSIPGHHIRAERANDTWQLTDPLNYPAQPAAVESLLKALEELTPQTHISAQELVDRPKMDAEFGFDSPQATLFIHRGSYYKQLKLGFLTAPGDGVYLQVVGSEGVDVVSADLFKLIPRMANDWRDTGFVNLEGLAFDRLAVTNANGSKIFEFQRDATNKLWRMFKPMPTRADNSKIGELLRQLQKVRVSRFETDSPKADLEAFGLQPPALELTLDQGTNHLLSLQFGKSPTNDDSLVYARRNGQDSVVLVPRQQLDPWRESFQSFRDRYLIGLDSGVPDVIEVRGPENFTMERQTNGAWRITQPQNFPVDLDLAREFLGRLGKLEVAPFNGDFAVKDAVLESDLPNYGLAPPARQYILKRNVANPPAASAVMVKLDFGSVKEDKRFARRSEPEESSVYAVREADFQRLPSRSLQLRERRVWKFTEDDVSSVTVRQNGTPCQLIRKGPNQWTIAAGSQGIIKNEFAVEAGVQDLGELEAETWVERGDQNRARYGFAENSLQISIDLKNGNQPRTLNLEFGGWSRNGLRYAMARLDGENWIFEFPPKLLERVWSYFNIHETAAR